MKNFTYMLLALLGLAATSCDTPTDFDNPASVKKAKERSDYILLCETEVKHGTLSHKMIEVLYQKPEANIPWTIGDPVSGPMLDIPETSRGPDRSVIFYENLGGKVRPMDTQLFYLSPPRDDANRLQKVITAIKK